MKKITIPKIKFTKKPVKAKETRIPKEPAKAKEARKSKKTTKVSKPVDKKYLITIPERTARALLSYGIGVIDLGINTVLPKTLKKTAFYKVSYGMMRSFIVEKILEMDKDKVEDIHEMSEDFMIRKIAGNSIEALGLFTIRFSPLWVFAVVSDVTKGSSVYFETLKAHLVENKVIETGEGIESVQELLDVLQKASEVTADTLDLPPIAIKDLKKCMSEITEAYSDLGAESKKVNLLIDNVWNEMKKISEEESVSFETLSGLMSADALKLYGTKTANSTKSFVMANYELLDAYVFRSYSETLSGIKKEGVSSYVQRHMEPFVELAKEVYEKEYMTWTGRAIKKLEGLRKK